MAVDCGTAVNPDRVKAQMEGACIYAMSACFFGEITAKQGRIQQHNFDDYPVARMDTSPKVIDVHVVESEEPPGGAGEPGVPPFAPHRQTHKGSAHRSHRSERDLRIVP
jgi:CO/xanthine dehydrogenase Mo-binding subunit